MLVPIRVPDLGTERARLSVWFVQPGERVYEGDRVAELLIPGATIDVSAPATGLLRETTMRVNDAVTPGQILGTVEAAG